jgi:hypothetical protein
LVTGSAFGLVAVVRGNYFLEHFIIFCDLAVKGLEFFLVIGVDDVEACQKVVQAGRLGI